MPEYIRSRAGSPNNPLQLRAKELGIVLVERDWIPSSRRAHECTEYARSERKLEPFHAAVLSAYWTDGADIHDWSVLEAAATAVGLVAATMRAQVEASQWKTAVDERVAAAHEIGIHAVPTFLFDERLAVQGAQPLDVFERVMQRVGATPRAGSS